jgi:hypothetical protein
MADKTLTYSDNAKGGPRFTLLFPISWQNWTIVSSH